VDRGGRVDKNWAKPTANLDGVHNGRPLSTAVHSSPFKSTTVHTKFVLSQLKILPNGHHPELPVANSQNILIHRYFLPILSFMQLYIDDREQAPDLVEYLRSAGELEIEIKRLALGDYQLGEEIIFERKTGPDFLESLCSERLFSQAGRLASSFMRPVMLFEWDPQDHPLRKKKAAYLGAIVSLSLIFGITPLWTYNAEGSASVILSAARQVEKIRRCRSWALNARKGKRNRTIRSRILQCIPGIGKDKADELLDHFGSIAAISAASTKEIGKVSGIGPKLSEKISQVLTPGEGGRQ
jgi:DNA excision repair protein ERCC-4